MEIPYLIQMHLWCYLNDDALEQHAALKSCHDDNLHQDEAFRASTTCNITTIAVVWYHGIVAVSVLVGYYTSLELHTIEVELVG